MLYLRLCYDKPGMTETRDAIRAAHRAYFVPNLAPDAAVRLIQAGPLCTDDADDTNIASFMILEAASREAVVRFHEGDPFTAAGIYGDVHIHRWDKHYG